MWRRKTVCLAGTLIGLGAAGTVFAQSPAFDIDFSRGFQEYVLDGTNGGMYGWTFSISQPVEVTALGWYDFGADGLNHNHQIGIWPGGLGGVSQDLVTSVVIPAGSAAELKSASGWPRR